MTTGVTTWPSIYYCKIWSIFLQVMCITLQKKNPAVTLACNS